MPFVPDKAPGTPAAAPAATAAPATRSRFVPDPVQPDEAPSPSLGARAVQLGKDAVGAGELLLSGATSLPAKAVAGIGGLAAGATNYFNRAVGSNTPDVDEAAVVRDLENQLTYQPRTASAQAAGNLIARGVDWVDQNIAEPTLGAVGSISPTAENVVRTAVPAAAEIVSNAVPVARAVTAPGRAFMVGEDVAQAARTSQQVGNAARTAERVAAQPPRPLAPATTPEEVFQRQAAASQQNMGAAAAAPNLTGASPELRAAIVETARKNGGAINPEAAQRYIDADAVFKGRAKLSEGQALQDARLISEEQNMRGRVAEFGKQFEAQSPALSRRLNEIRDEAGPDVFSANHVEHGDTLINRYKAVDAERSDAINKAYADLRAAAGGNFPIGGKTLYDNASKALHDKLIFDHAPKSEMAQLRQYAENPGTMTFENFETMRSNLAEIQRTSTSGLERRAAGVIRQAMEDLPLAAGAARLKPLADRARALARERFAAIEADPAYDAAINDTVAPDDFVRKFVTSGKRDNLARMAQVMQGDDAARQTMGVAALDYLREAARLNPHYEGNFAADSFDKALRRLGPGVQSMLPAKVIEDLEQLGRVARYTVFRPRGEFVNSSNTFTAAAAEGAKEATKGALEGVTNVASGGIPTGTWIRKGMEGAAHRRQARKAFDYRAGLGRLSETTKQ